MPDAVMTERRLGVIPGPAGERRLNPTPADPFSRGFADAGTGTEPAASRLTDREVDALLAVIEHADDVRAAHALGITPRAIRHRLRSLREKVGANSREHAAALLFRQLGHRYVLPGDEARRRVA